MRSTLKEDTFHATRNVIYDIAFSEVKFEMFLFDYFPHQIIEPKLLVRYLSVITMAKTPGKLSDYEKLNQICITNIHQQTTIWKNVVLKQITVNI